MDYKIMLRNGRYALLEMADKYIVACGFNETYPKGQRWDYGLYFEHWNESEIRKAEMLSRALNFYREKTEPNYNPTRQLEIYREDYTEAQFQEILNVMDLNNEEVGDSFSVYANVVRETLKEEE